MKILAFDTTATIESVAVYVDDRVVSVKPLMQRLSAAEILTTNIAEIMSEQNLQFSDLDAIVVSNGPASFTSVRIGLACAKGLSLASDGRLMMFDSLMTQAYGYRAHKGKITVAVDAKMDEYFVASFISDGETLSCDQQSRLVGSSELSDVAIEKGQFVIGSGASDLLAANSIKSDEVKVQDENGEQILAENLVLMAINCQAQATSNSSPNYIRNPKIGKRKNS